MNDSTNAMDVFERIVELEAEVERLNKQCEGLAQAAMNNGQDLLLKEAEIDQLKEELLGALKACGDYCSEIKHLRTAVARVERLEADLENQRLCYWHEHKKFEQLMLDHERLETALRECAKATEFDECTLQFLLTKEANIAKAALAKAEL